MGLVDPTNLTYYQQVAENLIHKQEISKMIQIFSKENMKQVTWNEMSDLFQTDVCPMESHAYLLKSDWIKVLEHFSASNHKILIVRLGISHPPQKNGWKSSTDFSQVKIPKSYTLDIQTLPEMLFGPQKHT